ncbi:MAG TPA: hypothetical protein VGM77_06310 [Gemmatimonadales bacterium]|jgi:hypothetical protein
MLASRRSKPPQKSWHVLMHIGISAVTCALIMAFTTGILNWPLAIALTVLTPLEVLVLNYWTRPRVDRLAPVPAIAFSVVAVVFMIVCLLISTKNWSSDGWKLLLLAVGFAGPLSLIIDGAVQLSRGRSEVGA